MEKNYLFSANAFRDCDTESDVFKKLKSKLLADDGTYLKGLITTACIRDDFKKLRDIYSVLIAADTLSVNVCPWFTGLALVFLRPSSLCLKFFQYNRAVQRAMVLYACSQNSTRELEALWRLGVMNVLEAFLAGLDFSLENGKMIAIDFFKNHRLGAFKSYRQKGYMTSLEPLLRKYWKSQGGLARMEDFFVFVNDPFLLHHLVDFMIFELARTDNHDDFSWRLETLKILNNWEDIPSYYLEYPNIIVSVMDTMVSSGWSYPTPTKIRILQTLNSNLAFETWDPTIAPESCYQLIFKELTEAQLLVLIDELGVVDPCDKELWKVVIQEGIDARVQSLLYSRMVKLSKDDPTKFVDLSKLGGLRRNRKSSKRLIEEGL